jgi:hypothetical protein
LAEAESAAVPQIQRMSRAPLRVEPAAPPADKPTHSPATSSDIFQLPDTYNSKPSGVADEAESMQEPEPAVEFPVIGAPDGSTVSRRFSPLPDPDQIRPALTDGLMQTLAHRASKPEPAPRSNVSDGGESPQRKTHAESSLLGNDVALDLSQDRRASSQTKTRYPQTNPATYRDPEYEIPSTAIRARGPSR